jgi:hypothetical protein
MGKNLAFASMFLVAALALVSCVSTGGRYVEIEDGGDCADAMRSFQAVMADSGYQIVKTKDKAQRGFEAWGTDPAKGGLPDYVLIVKAQDKRTAEIARIMHAKSMTCRYGDYTLDVMMTGSSNEAEQ